MAVATQIHSIAVHKALHLDEIASIWLLRMFGKEKYQGVEEAKIVIWSTGGGTPDDRHADEWEREGVLAVGVGLGKFDEHGPGNDGECAATLVARNLGISDDPALKRILDYVTRTDLTGGNKLRDAQFRIRGIMKRTTDDETLDVLTKTVEAVEQANVDSGNVLFALAQLVKDAHNFMEVGQVMAWAMFALDVRYQQQLGFRRAEEMYYQVATEVEVSVRGTRNVKVVTIESDDPNMKAVAFMKKAGVVIQRWSSGNVQIYTWNKLRANIKDLARAIRVEEQLCRGLMITTDFKTLEQEGPVSGAECWYYHSEGGILLNGSLSHSEVEPTCLSIEAVQCLVRLVLDETTFDLQFEDDCKKGCCKSSQDNSCPLYSYGLHRCRKMRWQMRNDDVH